MKAVHLTSVHSAGDPRIFRKQCRSLAAAGVDTVLIAPGPGDEEVDGVRIRAVPRPRSRGERWTRTIMAVFRAARDEDADLYHIHDPELLPIGLLLKVRGARVVYDVHEDYVTAIQQKRYVPGIVRSALARSAGWAERLVSSAFEIVIAERYYAERFAVATPVLNYPLSEYAPPEEGAFEPVPRLLYTGSVTTDRGAWNHARLLMHLPEYEVHLVGRVGSDLLARLRKQAGSAADRLVVPFVDRFVPPAQIHEYVTARRWLAGLAVFPRTPHYARKELTKFFEYMALGLPVVATDFAVWRELLGEAGAFVDPDDLDAAAATIRRLHSAPEAARERGSLGRRMTEQKYAWNSQAARLVQLYEAPGQS